MKVSPNFAFLKVHDSQLFLLGAQAERYFNDDPNTCLIKLRQFGELLAQLVAASSGIYSEERESQVDLLRRLASRGAVEGEPLQLFHELRMAGNRATHSLKGERRTALSGLKYARLLGIWFHRSYGKKPDFKPGPFIPPPDPADLADPADSAQESSAIKAKESSALKAAQAALAAAAEEAEATAAS